MAVSIQQYLNGAPMDDLSKKALATILKSIVADMKLVTTQLNADATVTDTTYGSTVNTTD